VSAAKPVSAGDLSRCRLRKRMNAASQRYQPSTISFETRSLPALARSSTRVTLPSISGIPFLDSCVPVLKAWPLLRIRYSLIIRILPSQIFRPSRLLSRRTARLSVRFLIARMRPSKTKALRKRESPPEAGQSVTITRSRRNSISSSKARAR
jgi:hypothetical protein